jgi:hypothetical protein
MSIISFRKLARIERSVFEVYLGALGKALFYSNISLFLLESLES